MTGVQTCALPISSAFRPTKTESPCRGAKGVAARPEERRLRSSAKSGGLVVQAVALGHFLPPGSQDLGSLAGHPDEQSAFFSSREQPGCCRSGLPQPAEGRADRKTQELCGPTEGGRADGSTERPTPAPPKLPGLPDRKERMKGPRPGKMPVWQDGAEEPDDGGGSVPRRNGPRQFPLRPNIVRDD